MGKRYIFAVYFQCMLFAVPFANAEVLQLDDALRATYTACMGIDEELADLKKMAGINTAVTAVGTVSGAGATVVGIAKSSVDKRLEELLSKIPPKTTENPSTDDVLNIYEKYVTENDYDKLEIQSLNDKSKKLGDWRTGLLAGNTATNVAGTIIASKNKVNKDLKTQINDCKAAVKNLDASIMQAKMDGEDVTEATKIFTACKEYDYVDISPINKSGKKAMISSMIGATTGAVGTITSAVANNDNTRNDSTDTGKQKEKNLNTASNVLAGTSTVASATATVFNATQISAIKKLANVAEKCEGVLQ